MPGLAPFPDVQPDLALDTAPMAAIAALQQTPKASARGRPPVVEAHDLVRRFGDFTAVDGISFDVYEGEIFALLGPNGAGKSTTINMLCTLAHPTAGDIRVAGMDVTKRPKAVRENIGLVFQDQTLDDRLTADENLRFHAVLYRVPRQEVEARIVRVLELVDLSDRRHDLVSEFSGGMARRLEIARALMHVPRVLFLDEPTIGLDPQTRALVWEDVQRLREEAAVTVLMTTHYMEEAEYADRIAIIDHGRIVALDSPAALKATIGADTVELGTRDDQVAITALRRAGYRAEPVAGGLRVFVEHGESAVPALIDAVGVPVLNVRVHQPTLDDVFLHYTGRQIRDSHAEAMPARMRAMRARRGR